MLTGELNRLIYIDFFFSLTFLFIKIRLGHLKFLFYHFIKPLIRMLEFVRISPFKYGPVCSMIRRFICPLWIKAFIIRHFILLEAVLKRPLLSDICVSLKF